LKVDPRYADQMYFKMESSARPLTL